MTHYPPPNPDLILCENEKETRKAQEKARPAWEAWLRELNQTLPQSKTIEEVIKGVI